MRIFKIVLDKNNVFLNKLNFMIIMQLTSTIEGTSFDLIGSETPKMVGGNMLKGKNGFHGG
jgi:hypothetical protein